MSSEETEQDNDIYVVRDNTVVLLLFLLVMAVTMVLLSVALVRLGNISRKLDINLAYPPQLYGGGGAGRADQYFRVL